MTVTDGHAARPSIIGRHRAGADRGAGTFSDQKRSRRNESLSLRPLIRLGRRIA